MTRAEEFLKRLENDIEWLETSEGDEVECIGMENLRAHLENYFGDEKADK
jgi:hypothetical protein